MTKRKKYILPNLLIFLLATNGVVFCKNDEKSATKTVMEKIGSALCSSSCKAIENIPLVVVGVVVSHFSSHVISELVWPRLKYYLKPITPSERFDKCTSILNTALEAKKRGRNSCYSVSLKQYQKEIEEIQSLDPTKLFLLLNHVDKLEQANEKKLSEWQNDNYQKFVTKTKPMTYQKFINQKPNKRSKNE